MTYAGNPTNTSDIVCKLIMRITLLYIKGKNVIGRAHTEIRNASTSKTARYYYYYYS